MTKFCIADVKLRYYYLPRHEVGVAGNILMLGTVSVRYLSVCPQLRVR